MTSSAIKVFPLATACGAFCCQAKQITTAERNEMRNLLGAKAAGLAEMLTLGINVPPGLTITTNVCREFHDNNAELPDGLMDEVLKGLRRVELSTGCQLGNEFRPLLLSVRAGAKVDMPGMMDTILNLGLNEVTAQALGDMMGEQFAYDSFRRFVEQYGSVVLGVPKEQFVRILKDATAQAGVPNETKLSVDQLKELIERYQTFIWDQTGKPFPRDVHTQLRGAISAVFKSWNSERAVFFRRHNGISDDIGTAVTLQAMVFGNLNKNSATGVCFTRDPSTGEPFMQGEYLVNSQGGEVLAGARKTKRIFQLEQEMPAVYEQLAHTASRLEGYYRDAQEVHFTVQDGVLFVLQSRTGVRTAQAAVRIAVDLANDDVITREQAVKRIAPDQWTQLLRPVFTGESLTAAKMCGRHVATGIAAAPGAATGKIVFDPEEAASRAALGEKVILVGAETCPVDIAGVVPVQGIVTERGGVCCFGAEAARGQGKPCITGCETLKVDHHNQLVMVGRHAFFKNDVISIDGSNGEIYAGAVEPTRVKTSPHLDQIVSWAAELGINVL